MAASAGGIRAGRAFVEFYGNDSPLVRTMRSIDRRMQSWGKRIATIGGAFFAAGSAIMGPLIAAAKVFDSMGSEMADMAARTGASVEALSTLGYAAEQTGASLGDVEKAMRFMAKSGDFAGKSTDEAFRSALRRIAAVPDSMRRAELAMKLFGKSGAALIPMAMDLKQLEDRAKRLGIEMSTKDAQAADALGDAWGDLAAVGKALVFQVGAALAPVLTDLVTQAAEVASVFIRWAKDNRGLIISIAKIAAGAMAIGAVLIAVGATIAGVGAAIGVLSTIGVAVFSAIAAAVSFLLSPIGLVIAAIVGLSAAFLAWTESGQAAVEFMSGAFGTLAGDTTTALGAIRDALMAGDLSAAVKVLWALIKLEWTRGVEFVVGIWSEMNTAISAVFINTAAFLESAWVGLTSSLSAVWDSFVSFMLDRFGGAIAKVISEMARAKALLAGMNEKEAAFVASLTEVGVKASMQIKAGEHGSSAVQTLLDRDAKLAEIEERRKQTLAENEGINQSRIAELEREKAAAMAEFEQAVTAAQSSGEKGASVQSSLKLPQLSESFEKTKTSVSGTFSAFQAAGLGGDRTQEQILGENKKQSQLLNKIAGKKAGLAVT